MFVASPGAVEEDDGEDLLLEGGYSLSDSTVECKCKGSVVYISEIVDPFMAYL